MIITITGTPGTGKTYIAKKLIGRKLKYIDLNSIIKKDKLYEKYDKTAKTYDVNVEELNKLNNRFESYKDKDVIDKKLIVDKKVTDKKQKHITEYTLAQLKNNLKNKSGLIIDSHLSQYIDSNLCIVVKADIKSINARLNKRNYPKQKITDNIESEIFDICLEEAKNLKRNIVILKND